MSISLEERMAKVEGTLSQVAERLNHLESGLEGLRREMDSRFEGLRREISSNFRWTIGMWITAILAIMLKGRFY